MWIDNTSSSPYAGYVYDAWTCFGGTNDGQIQITRSTTGGVSWSAPTAISAAVNAGSLNHGVNISKGPGGQVYVVWAIYDSWPSDETALGFTKSTNGGSSYGSAARIISNIRGIRYSGTSKNQRVNSFPSMAVDISGGPNNGNIYVVWTNIGVPVSNIGTDIDVYMIRSTDQGSTWSAPIRVNQDPIGLGKEHYFPWITCDRATGELSVVFYDDRNVSSTQCETWVAYSHSAGDLWEDFKVSDVAFTPTPIPGLATGYMGDYLGISANDAKVYPTWTDNRTGTPMTYVSPYNLLLAPAVYFKANTNLPCLNQTVLFQDMTLKNPTSWLWTIIPANFTFVNGTSSASQNPQVQFTSFGNYDVRLIASNTNGADTLLRPGFISVNNGNADFSASLTHINTGNSTIFNEISTCGNTSYLWSFGSGATPSTATTAGPVTVLYSTPGFKNVSLTVNGNIMKIKNNYVIVDASYCTAGTTTCDEFISNVVVGNIYNSSNCTAGGYQAYTQYWTRVSPSVGYPVTVTNGLAYPGDQCGIWVDWNQNLSFSDAGETMTVTTIGGGTSFTATITPPVNAPKGLTRMRARIAYSGSLPACGNTQYGEAEDYSVYVGTPGLWAGGTAGSPTNWNTANNWDDGIVPASTLNVTIPAGLAYYPVVSGNFSCLDMTVQDGAAVTVQSGAVLNVNGNLNVGQGVSGLFVVDGGTCNVTGTVTALQGSTVDIKNGGTIND